MWVKVNYTQEYKGPRIKTETSYASDTDDTDMLSQLALLRPRSQAHKALRSGGGGGIESKQF